MTEIEYLPKVEGQCVTTRRVVTSVQDQFLLSSSEVSHPVTVGHVFRIYLSVTHRVSETPIGLTSTYGGLTLTPVELDGTTSKTLIHV